MMVRRFAEINAAMPSAREVAGRIILAARMLEIADLRRLMDEGERELDVFRAEYRDAFYPWPDGIPHPRYAEFFHKADPIYQRISRLEGLLEALERLPVDDLTQGIALKANPTGGA